MSDAIPHPLRTMCMTAAWLVGAGVEVFLARGSFVPPSDTEVALALGGALLVGGIQGLVAARLPLLGWAGWVPVAFFLSAEVRTEPGLSGKLVAEVAAIALIALALAHLSGRRPPRTRGAVMALLLAPQQC